MKHFTGWQYLLIDVANQAGFDKLTFEERIKWTETHLESLESLVDIAEVQPLYLKAVMALRMAQKGIATGHLVELDACASGIQIMSAMTGCIAGASATGLVDPDVRADAYTQLTKTMNEMLGGGLEVSRSDAKGALMKCFYGSKKAPVEVFGEDTDELSAFYKAAVQVAPGAWGLLQELLGAWQPYALSHQWQLPDGYEAKVKVMVKKEIRVEVDEINHATFEYTYYENQGSEVGLSLAANTVHSEIYGVNTQ